MQPQPPVARGRHKSRPDELSLLRAKVERQRALLYEQLQQISCSQSRGGALEECPSKRAPESPVGGWDPARFDRESYRTCTAGLGHPIFGARTRVSGPRG